MITIETDKKFSDSFIWDAQREYYHQEGIRAWAGDVPFYITSNPYISKCYARIVMRYIQDRTRMDSTLKQHPFYILELGTGSGQFSFYVLQEIKRLKKALHLNDIKICYIMSDFTTNNLKFWQTHPALQSFIEEGALDFAIFDIENDKSIKLEVSKQELNARTLKNPLFVFANYLFDSIKNDVFAVKEGQIYESLANFTTPTANFVNNKPKDLKKLNLKFTDNLITKPYYNHPIMDEILFSYTKLFKNTHFLFPISMLKGVENLYQISNGKLLLISSDKGYATIEEMDESDAPELDFHGSFSLMVNFHALAEYFKHKQGDSALQLMRNHIMTAIFSSGIKLAELTETSLAINEYLNCHSPADYFNLYDHLSEQYDKCDIDVLSTLLCLSHWDPYIFCEVEERLGELLDEADESMELFFAENFAKIADNYYFIPDTDDALFGMGTVLHNLERYQQALPLYFESERYFGENDSLYFNIGDCYYALGDYAKAKYYLAKSLRLDPASVDAKELLAKAEAKLKQHGKSEDVNIAKG